MTDGPSVESEIWQYYKNLYPNGQVKVLGADNFSGTPAQLQSFKDQTGVTYPLLLNAGSTTGGNMFVIYGDRDNFVIVDPSGIVRYHAQDLWAYGNRYHRDELRAIVNAYVGQVVGVDPIQPGRAFRLDVSPNPFAGNVTFAFSHPGTAALDAEVTVHDLAGRRVATLWRGLAEPGWTRGEWNGRTDAGSRAPAGVYLVRARLGARTLVQRVVRMP